MSANSLLTLILFFITNLVVLFPFHVPIPIPTFVVSLITEALVYWRLTSPPLSLPKITPQLSYKVRWFNIYASFRTAPLFSVLLLLATRAIDGTIVRQGILGADGIQPLDIMALFISLAYMSISLDTTGLFRFLAFWVARKGGSSGRRLYFLLYIFFLVSGVVVGNDPVVLSGTAFLAYFTRVSGITPPTAWIFAQFTAANMASAVLPPSNPTNLVLTGAFAIPFLTYTAHTVLPVLAAAFAVYPLLTLCMFRSPELIPRQIDLLGLDSAPLPPANTGGNASEEGNQLAVNTDSVSVVGPAPGTLTDRHGAIFGSVLLSITLVVLVGTSPLKVPVWEVTIPPALIMIARDIWHDRGRWRLRNKEGTVLKDDNVRDAHHSGEPGVELQLAPTFSTRSPRHPRTVSSLIGHMKNTALPTLCTIVPRLPLALLPFALCMFVLVQGLVAQGWVEVFARWWTAWVHVCAQAGPAGAVVGAVGLMAVLTTLLCNICGTNIGTTILLARVLKMWLETASTAGAPIDMRVRTGTIYALALGSNFGAFSFSFSASLAGLLWRAILHQKGIHIRQRQFALLNLPIVTVAVCVAAGVLVAEVFITNN